jgi:hypothetical protein
MHIPYSLAYVQVFVLKVVFFTEIHTVVMHQYRENSHLVDMIPLLLKA